MSISFQLYSARNFTPWNDVLATLARIGYTHVEGFGGCYEDPTAFRASMDANGLTMPSGHFGIDDLEQDFEGAISTAKTLGIKTIVCPYIEADQRPTDSAGWKAIAARLAVISEKVAAAGFGFCWHNHEFEFIACTDDGSMPMTILLDTVPTMNWEADIAWIVRGGADPLEWIERYGSRIKIAHTKDIAPEGECLDEDGWADLGEGVVDWKTISAALHAAGTSLYAMEHDNPNDLERFASRSFQALKALQG